LYKAYQVSPDYNFINRPNKLMAYGRMTQARQLINHLPAKPNILHEDRKVAHCDRG